jgi:hypothetical protein
MPLPDEVTECLKPRELLEFEGKSLEKMFKLAWPRSLSLWKNEIIKAAREVRSSATLCTHVAFDASDPRSGKLHEIVLGANINLAKPPHLATYFFAIGGKDDNDKRIILRKVHFDLQNSKGSNEPKPTLHLQVAGGPSPALLERGYEEAAFSHLEPAFEKPRVPCLPQCFALLVHTALLEYHSTDDNLRKFVQSSGWLSIVRNAEEVVLKPFFEYGHQRFVSAAKGSGSLLNYFYGLSE